MQNSQSYRTEHQCSEQSIKMCFRLVHIVLGLLITLLHFTRSSSPRCVVKYENGVGTGLLNETFTKRLYCAYLGIPYVQPPVGELRFEDPVPSFFNGSVDFHHVRSPCTQVVTLEGTEDCLYLNIYTTHVSGTARRPKKMPVLVWVHGGSFTEGSSETDIFGPEPILDKDIIVVTFNYRLASFGFLGIVDLDIHSNLGLRDQTEAFRWVNRNIRNFGGNPNRVTLLGWSAGAASVTYHMYTVASKELFQNVIAMSGTMTQPWAYNFDPQGCSNDYLNKIDATTKEELKARPEKLMIPYLELFKTHCYMPSEDPIYAPKNPYAMVQEIAPLNDVPLLIGTTRIEHQAYFINNGFYDIPSNCPNTNATIQERILNFLTHTWANRSVSKSALLATGDILFGVNYFIKNAALHFESPIYRYKFSFDGPFGYPKNVAYRNERPRTIPGAMHGDDLGYIFTPYNYRNMLVLNQSSSEFQPYKKSLRMQRQMVRLWTNFIKSNNPTPNNRRINQTIWHPYNDRNPQLAGQYLDIGKRLRMTRDQAIENYYQRLWGLIFGCLYHYECDFLDANQDNGN
ncbi:juvenile hormone esterase-like [Malaya genurostris]|uniref:juvenile hormone esterase-like n=1 Tax=Malaya genurostris TaxID=325434 RepID=UPI0026F383EA|nr:juvenile hormone esterase-like [Malaya genurostris]